ncbi:MAG: hypothetical protein O2U62_06600 [Candidatus Bathyarchaeota archaeon]|nr:hypothetical protein [Candidatus Bathyarchaeota archaeon]
MERIKKNYRTNLKNSKEIDSIFDSKRLTVITLLGTLAFVSNGFLPSPVDKMVIGIQALSFSLASLLVAKGGAIYATFVTGLLLSISRTSFFPFSLIFSLFYGLLIDGFFSLFKVNEGNYVKSKRLILLLTVATGITGVVSMFLTTMLNIIPMIPTIYFAIIVGAVLNGSIAGYLTVIIWNRFLYQRFVS